MGKLYDVNRVGKYNFPWEEIALGTQSNLALAILSKGGAKIELTTNLSVVLE